MNFFLNKGGAGKSFTRTQTVAEVSTLMTGYIALLQRYDALANAMNDSGVPESLKVSQKQQRADIAKLSEIILSSGGIPPRRANPPEENDVTSLIRAISNGERSIREALEDQLGQKHHLRTLAVLKTLQVNTEQRIGEVQSMAQQRSIPVN